LLVAIAIIGILIGLTLSAVQKVRASAAKTQCLNQIKQQALGLQNYHGTNNRFPAGTTIDDPGKPPMKYSSWMVRILPYVDQGTMANRIEDAFRSNASITGPAHSPLFSKRIPVFLCPTDQYGQTPYRIGQYSFEFASYVGMSGTNFNTANGVLYADSRVRISDITDGTSSTILIGERHNGYIELGWWYGAEGQDQRGSASSHLGSREINRYSELPQCPHGPYHFREGRPDNPCHVFRYWSSHTNGAHFAYADGSVHFLTLSADDILEALSTRAGGESITP
jgi:prepilin-type processing-associated H-X9-DG protein